MVPLNRATAIRDAQTQPQRLAKTRTRAYIYPCQRSPFPGIAIFRLSAMCKLMRYRKIVLGKKKKNRPSGRSREGGSRSGVDVRTGRQAASGTHRGILSPLRGFALVGGSRTQGLRPGLLSFVPSGLASWTISLSPLERAGHAAGDGAARFGAGCWWGRLGPRVSLRFTRGYFPSPLRGEGDGD